MILIKVTLPPFERSEEEDLNYLRTIKEEAKEKGNNVHEVAWGLDDVDWEIS